MRVVVVAALLCGCVNIPPFQHGGSADGGTDGAKPNDGPPSGPCAAALSTPNLLAYLPFDEATGATAADLSSLHHDATLAGAGFVTGAHVGGGVEFDGMSDHAKFDDPDAFDQLPAITACAWINMNAPTNASTIVDKSADGMADGWNMYLQPQITATSMRVAFYTSFHAYAFGISVVPVHQWTHVCTTWDGSAGIGGIGLYFNGAQDQVDGEVPGIATRDSDAANPLAIARCASTNDFYFNGVMDELVIYDRALNANEIAAIHDCAP